MRLLALIFILICSVTVFAEDAPTAADGEEKPAPPPPPKPVWTAHILREKKPEARLAELYVHEAKVPVVLVAREGGFKSMVELRGRFWKPGWTLSVGKDLIAMKTPEGDFSIPAYVTGRVNEIVLTAKGPAGETLSERIFIYAPDAQEFRQVSPNDAILIGIGGGYMHYSQTHSVYFKSLTGLVYGKLNYPNTDSKFGIFIDAEATGVTIAAAPIDVGPQLVRGKGDIIYRRNKSAMSRWRMEYVFGVSYLTLIGNGSPFGFSNLISPEAGIRARYTADPKTTWIIEARYIPIKEPFKFENKGFDVEFTWARVLPNVHRLEFGFSYYNFNYHPSDDVRIDTGLLVYRLGYGI